MTRLLIPALSLTLLAGCGAAPLHTFQATDPASTEATRLETRIVGTVGHSKLVGRDVLTMTLEAKRPLAKNIVQDYAFYRFMDYKTRRWRGSSSGSRLFLAKDGGVYISSGANNTELWYRVATYQAPTSGRLTHGDRLDYRLDGAHEWEPSRSAIHLNIFHVYQSAHSSELEFSRIAPQLIDAE